MTNDVISLSISVLLLFRHYISHKITFGAPSSGGVLCSACGAFIFLVNTKYMSSRELKTSKFSFVLRTHENSDVFNTLDEINEKKK